MSADRYSYVREYEVAPDTETAFLTHYGSDGVWAQLFRRASGYLGTELYRDRKRRERFITIDHWQSEAAFRRFRTRFASEVEMLGRHCESFTTREASLGQFDSVAGPALPHSAPEST